MYHKHSLIWIQTLHLKKKSAPDEERKRASWKSASVILKELQETGTNKENNKFESHKFSYREKFLSHTILSRICIVCSPCYCSTSFSISIIICMHFPSLVCHYYIQVNFSYNTLIKISFLSVLWISFNCYVKLIAFKNWRKKTSAQVKKSSWPIRYAIGVVYLWRWFTLNKQISCN